MASSTSIRRWIWSSLAAATAAATAAAQAAATAASQADSVVSPAAAKAAAQITRDPTGPSDEEDRIRGIIQSAIDSALAPLRGVVERVAAESSDLHLRTMARDVHQAPRQEVG